MASVDAPENMSRAKKKAGTQHASTQSSAHTVLSGLEELASYEKSNLTANPPEHSQSERVTARNQAPASARPSKEYTAEVPASQRPRERFSNEERTVLYQVLAALKSGDLYQLASANNAIIKVFGLKRIGLNRGQTQSDWILESVKAGIKEIVSMSGKDHKYSFTDSNGSPDGKDQGILDELMDSVKEPNIAESTFNRLKRKSSTELWSETVRMGRVPSD